MVKSDHWECNYDQIDTRDYSNVVLEAVDAIVYVVYAN
jgi:hypothetical protein